LMIPLALRYFRKAKISAILLHSIPIIIGLLLFLLLRNGALGDSHEGTVMNDPLNQPFLEWNGQSWDVPDPSTKAATIIYTLGRYVGLMLVPYPLTHEYYPFHIQLQSFSNLTVIISTVILLVMFIYGIWSLKKRDKGGFGILFFLGTLSITANIFFPVGTFMAERFLFLPSIGFLLGLVTLIFQLWGSRKNEILILLFGGIVIIYSIITFVRNPAWKSNESLFRSDIHYSPNSAKLRNNLGTLLLDQALAEKDVLKQKVLLQEALPHLKKATELHPTYYDAYLAYGACAYYLGEFEQSVLAYRTSSRLFPQDLKSNMGLWFALQAEGKNQWTKGDTSLALISLEEAWSMQPDTLIAKELANYYQLTGNKEKEKTWRERQNNK
jgi:protein O-mannosyl-transferase